MAKSRVEKNKKLYETLDEEMKNNKENAYEEKLKAIDPELESKNDESFSNETNLNSKKVENKSVSQLNEIAKEINGEKKKKDEIVVVKKEVKKEEKVEEEEEPFVDPISFTDKLSVEEILRAKIEQQQKIKDSKKGLKKGPNDENYTPEMMQERILQHEGIDVRKELKMKRKSNKVLVLSLLFIALILVLIVGALLIFKVIKL